MQCTLSITKRIFLFNNFVVSSGSQTKENSLNKNFQVTSFLNFSCLFLRLTPSHIFYPPCNLRAGQIKINIPRIGNKNVLNPDGGGGRDKGGDIYSFRSEQLTICFTSCTHAQHAVTVHLDNVQTTRSLGAFVHSEFE